MTRQFPANNGSKAGTLLPGLSGHLAMEDQRLGFLRCNLDVHALRLRQAPHSSYCSVPNGKDVSNF